MNKILPLIFPYNFQRVQKISLLFPGILRASLLFWCFFLILIILSGFYLYQIERLTIESYFFQKISQEIKSLQKENSTLKERYSQQLSLGNFEKKIKNLNFVKVSKIRYLPLSSEYLVTPFPIK